MHSDHYKLTTQLNDYRGRDLLFFTQDSLPDVTKFVASQSRLSQISTKTSSERSLNLDVYLLNDFKGY